MITITKEQAKDLRNAFQCWQQDYDPVEDKEQYDMFGLGMVAMDALLASLEAEPIYQLWDEGYYDTEKETYDAVLKAGGRGRIVYTAPPAPVVPAELHPDTQKLVTDFCTALAEKLYKAQLKYGYDADWKHDGWPTQCQAHFHQHIAKGDPRDVAAYCAFMWYHGWKTEPAPVSVPDDEQGKPHPVMAVKGELGFLDHFDRIISERDEDIDIGQLGCSNYEALTLAALDAFRAAMLHDSEPVTTAYKLPEETGSSLQLRNLIRQRHAEWSQATFGDVGPIGPLKHLSKEALEAAAEPDDLSEWADMQFLLWDAQRRAGISDGEITAAMEEKLKVNMARQWPEPKDGEPRLHIKEQSESSFTEIECDICGHVSTDLEGRHYCCEDNSDD